MVQLLRHGMRLIKMPELPEVETVKKTLEKEILGAILLKPTIYYSPLIKTDLAEYQRK